MNRFFAFGSCFTKWNWPTWADIIGSTFQEYHNWGRPYLGNTYISHSIVEAHLKHDFRPTDTVIVMWSNFGRTDQYKDNKWIGHLTAKENINDLRGSMLQDLSAIFLIKNLLESINCKWYFCSIVDFPNVVCDDHGPFGVPSTVPDDVSDIVNLYQPILGDLLPSVHSVVFDYNWHSRALPDPTNSQMNNNEWVRESYNSCKGIDWPNFDDYVVGKTANCSKDILKEIQIKDMQEKWTKSLNPRFDYHPTPIEWLEYVQCVFPQYTIDYHVEQKLKDLEQQLRMYGRVSPEHMNFFKRILPELL